MTITTPGTFVRQRDLVRVTDLDPEQELVGRTVGTGDVSGGQNRVDFLLPGGIAWLVYGVMAELSNLTNPVAYLIQQGLDSTTVETIFESGAAGINLGSVNIPQFFNPPPILLIDPIQTVRVTTENILAETMLAGVVCIGWDLRDARNIPFRFLWPGRI